MGRTLNVIATLLVLLFATSAYGQAEVPESADSAIAVDTTGAGHETTVVYYFHGNKRCPTCRKIEALSEQALRTGFESALADSTIKWRVINFEEDDNAHFAKHYKLFSQTLIVSRQRDGEEVAWKNLDQIWQLVHDEDAFVAYVQAEVAAPIEPDVQ